MGDLSYPPDAVEFEVSISQQRSPFF